MNASWRSRLTRAERERALHQTATGVQCRKHQGATMNTARTPLALAVAVVAVFCGCRCRRRHQAQPARRPRVRLLPPRHAALRRRHPRDGQFLARRGRRAAAVRTLSRPGGELSSPRGHPWIRNACGTRPPKRLPLGKSEAVRDQVVCVSCHFLHAADADHALLRGFPGSAEPGHVRDLAGSVPRVPRRRAGEALAARRGRALLRLLPLGQAFARPAGDSHPGGTQALRVLPRLQGRGSLRRRQSLSRSGRTARDATTRTWARITPRA